MAEAWRNRIVGYSDEPPDQLLASPFNWRIHPKPQQDALLGVLREAGIVQNILVNRTTGNLIDGHLRVSLAMREGQPTVPVTWVELSESEEQLVLAALDPIAALAVADKEKLDMLLRDVKPADAALQHMLSELAAREGLYTGNGGGAPDDVPAPQIDRAAELQKLWKTATGQIWVIPSRTVFRKVHRLLCGNSFKPESLDRLMGGAQIEAVITDPPYGIEASLDYTRFTGGVAPQKHRQKRVMANDDRPFNPELFLDYPSVVLWGANCFSDRLSIGSWLVWDKRHANGTAFFSEAEVAWMKGGHGVYLFAQTSQGFVRDKPSEHPTEKPVSLMVWCMDKANAGNYILDPFLGSGTTLIACEQTGRIAYGCEIDPPWLAVTLQRLQDMGLTPQLVES